jgi:hypothetical protein
MKLRTIDLHPDASEALWAAFVRKDATWLSGIGLVDPRAVTSLSNGFAFDCVLLRSDWIDEEES